MIRLWPRSLAGQMALLIAVALFAAQAINFALILRDRAGFRLAQATGPVATRIADALEREARGERPIVADRGRIRRLPGNPIPPTGAERHPEVATELRQQLAELGIRPGRIDTGLEPRSNEAAAGRVDRRRRGEPPFSTLRIAVEQPGRGWLVIAAPWPEAGSRLLISLLIQTLILYAVVLLPVLWVARRLSRPLRVLADAAGRFDPTIPAEPIAGAGPDDLRQLILAFNGLHGRVRAMLDEKDRMLGAIGHDLRTPLAALRVRVESVEDDTDRVRMADIIEEMSRTLDDILTLARLGRPGEPETVVDLAALVDAVVEDFRDLDQDVTLIKADRLPLRCRPVLMRRAVRNLIENAIKYGERARVRIDRGPARVTITVSDAGPGIPPAQLEAVFDAFTRLEGSRNRDTGGIGLGLALARAIVREAGGDITLANGEAGGLNATISLPAHA